MSGSEHLIVGERTVEGFFHQALADAQADRGHPLPDEVGWYLVQLLKDFTLARNFFLHSAPGDRGPQALALILGEALDASGADRIRTLKHLGDVSLYVSGFFAESLSGRSVGIDYYAGMGGAAYSRLAAFSELPGEMQDLFLELSDRFLELTDILGSVSEAAGVEENSDLLSTYGRWLVSGSERLRLRLVAAGIDPLRPAAPLPEQ